MESLLVTFLSLSQMHIQKDNAYQYHRIMIHSNKQHLQLNEVAWKYITKFYILLV